MSVELTLTIPREWWHTSNDRGGWRKFAHRKKYIRLYAGAEARNARLPRFATVHVCAWIGYPKAGRADPSNASPVVKAALDGLTDAGVWLDDDSDHVVAVEYRRDRPSGQVGVHTVRLTITEQEVTW